MTTLAMHSATLSPLPQTVATLADVPRGRSARIGSVRTQGPLGDQLLELGLTPGTLVDVLSHSRICTQLGVRGFILSLHPSQARDVEVSSVA